MPTNFENWQIYTQNLTSPQSYIDFSYYFLITSCLQRRVWYDEEPWQVFPNLYIALTGPPAVGKGLCIGAVSKFLKYHRLETGLVIRTNIGQEKPLLYPNGADCITFEQLLTKFALSGRRFATTDNKPYFHSSLWFTLEELASIVKRKTDDVVRFFQNAYDCKDYDYEIKHQEKKDRIRNLCLSFLAGTQPAFLIDAQKKGIFDQGFTSRIIFLFENEPRFIRWHIAHEISAEQKQAEIDLLAWIKKLSEIHGRITYDQTTHNFLEDYYINKAYPALQRASPKFAEFLGRIKVHTMKLAAALHFSESLEMNIPLIRFQEALQILEGLYHRMEAGLNLIGRNELHSYSRKILSFIKSRKEVLEGELIIHFASDINIEEMLLCIKELELGFNLKTKMRSDGKRVYYL